MKLITIILLINWLLCNTINAQTCRDPIVILNQKIPQTIDFVKLGFGKGLNSDKTIIIVGTPTNQTDQFAINLAEEGELFKTANVPFHFNPRFGYEQVVVRNSWNKTSGWGTEERSGGFPFAIGQTFVLKLSIISARIPGISININNKFFVSYRRYRFYDITQLNIVGAIQLSSITLCNPPLPRPPCLFQYVFANPEIPVNYNFLTIGSNFGTGFLPPKKITIIGTPTNNTYEPNDFIINMGESGIMLNNATVVFSYNPRFDVNQVIRNTWTVKDGWGIEESFGWFPFTIGKTFKMEIIAAKNNTINVNVDNNLLSFSRLDLSKVTQIEISKAIEVASVVFCN